MQDLISNIDEQFLQKLIIAIEAHAQPRPYDWMLLVFTALSIMLSFTAIWCTIRVSKNQNDTELFDKRFDVYQKVDALHTLQKSVKHARIKYNNNYPIVIDSLKILFIQYVDTQTLVLNSKVVGEFYYNYIFNELKVISKHVDLLFSLSYENKLNKHYEYFISVMQNLENIDYSKLNGTCPQRQILNDIVDEWLTLSEELEELLQIMESKLKL